MEASVPRTAAPHPCYGFQRGNITFSTKPPGDSNSLPTRRTPQPYGRRCMSTCNITLDPPTVVPRCHHTVTLSCAPPDECDVCTDAAHSPTTARRAHTFTSHFCTRVPDKTTGTKTVASQTSQIFTPPSAPPPTSQLQLPGEEEKEKSGSRSPRVSSILPLIYSVLNHLNDSKYNNLESPIKFKREFLYTINKFALYSNKKT